MKERSIKPLLVSYNKSMKDTMRVIDKTGLNVAFVVDKKGKLIGAISDGDIRRAILRGIAIDTQVKEVMNRDPIVIKESELKNRNLVRQRIKKLHSRMRDAPYIPVVSDKYKPLKLFSCKHLLQIKLRGPSAHKSVRKVLVVGGAGFLGSVLVRKLLQRGYEVRVLDILLYGSDSISSFMRKKGFEFIKGDMRNISTLVKSLRGVDAVVNLAAIVGDPACSNKPGDTVETNYLANKVLADACKYHQINRFIFASTCSVYGVATDKLNESSLLRPVSLYARSKIQSEEGILSLEDENFSPTIFRMATLYGLSPRMRFDLVVNIMVKDAVVNKKIVVTGGGNQWRPFLSLEDAAEAYIKCLEAPIEKVKGEIFNVGDDAQNYRIKDIANIVKRHIPEARIIYRGKTIDKRNYIVSFEKIKQVLGFKAKYSIDKSIEDIKEAILSGKIKNVNDRKYYN